MEEKVKLYSVVGSVHGSWVVAKNSLKAIVLFLKYYPDEEIWNVYNRDNYNFFV